MGRLRELLGKKVAGVPVAYIALFAVIGLAVYAWQTQSVSADDGATDDADATETDSAGGDLDDSGQPVFVANPSTNPVGVTDPATNAPVSVDDNDLWLKRTVAWLVQKGYAGAGDAQSAMSKYLNGDNLSYDEGQLRDKAIAQYGLPPEPPTPGTTAGKAATRQFSHFPGVHTVQGANDNTYAKIAQLYWGRQDAASISALTAANVVEIGHGGSFPKGTKVKVPAYAVPKYYTATSATKSLPGIARKNGMAQARLQELNPTLKFPVAVGTRVRIK